MKKLEIFIKVFLILGILISLFLLYEHFSYTADRFCTFGESLNCGIVNKGPYSTLDGISYLLTIDFGLNIPFINLNQYGIIVEFLTTNSFLGLLTLVILFLLVHKYFKEKDFLFIKNDKILYFIRGITLFSLIYGFYLFLIQHYILKTYCIFCLGLDFVIIVTFITTWFLLNKKV